MSDKEPADLELLYSVRHGNIYFVPVLRQRLTFAIVVRRAVEELNLDLHDCIAVELPPSIKDRLDNAIGLLPEVSVIVARDMPGGPQEAFAVTPGDGIIEAIRTASEERIDREYIDNEISPGALWQRHCMVDSTWPDDDYALQCGVTNYLRLIGPRLAHPPSRLEPVDSGREAHMAGRLQALSPRYRRILAVCDPARVGPVRALLRSPASVPRSGMNATQVSWRRMRPSVPTMLSYLDEIPRLVERYEDSRRLGLASQFDKFQTVIDLIGECDIDESGGAPYRWSIRHYSAFIRTLWNIREFEASLSPRLETILFAAEACFGLQFGDTIRRVLLGYGVQADVEHVFREDAGGRLGIRKYASRNLYASRSCNPQRRTYVRIPLPPPEEEDWFGDENSWIWPSWIEALVELRKKVFELAVPRTFERRSVSRRFQGSLENGIDLRRSMRSVIQRSPQLFVKSPCARIPAPVDTREPIVWLFHTAEPDSFFITLHPTSEEAVVFLTFNSPENHIQVPEPAKQRVTKTRLGGLISFVQWERNMYDLKRRYVDDYGSRVPIQQAFEIHPLYGFLHKNTFQFIEREGELAWRDILILTALEYTARDLFIVAPESFELSNQIRHVVRVRGRNIVMIPQRLFGASEIERIQIRYSVSADSAGALSEDERSNFDVRGQLGRLMKQLGLD